MFCVYVQVVLKFYQIKFNHLHCKFEECINNKLVLKIERSTETFSGYVKCLGGVEGGDGGGLRIYFCENSPEIFHFFTLLLEIPGKTKINSWIFHKIVLAIQIPWKFQGQKQRPVEIPHYFFFVTLGNSTSFLINTQKFHVLFL